MIPSIFADRIVKVQGCPARQGVIELTAVKPNIATGAIKGSHVDRFGPIG
ncbi:MAG: hypothetical protein U0T81_06275 [Saprospiraceae bacterium]